MMQYFATLFDINYLPRAMVMFNSMQEHSSINCKLFVLALDSEVEKYFKENINPNITVIPESKILDYFSELENLKKERSRAEYCFTLSPYLPIYIFDIFKEVNQITTLDADLMFFDDVNIIFEKYKNASVLITPHAFVDKLKHLVIYGIFNVSFQSFKKDVDGLKILHSWKENCKQWCEDKIDETGTKFADQKYLDTWKSQSSKVEIIEIAGAGVAPWNIESKNLKYKKRKFYVENETLIYYHFQGFRVFNNNICFHSLKHYMVSSIPTALKSLYLVYIKRLKEISKSNTDFNI